jgi:hypothetical protein
MRDLNNRVGVEGPAAIAHFSVVWWNCFRSSRIEARTEVVSFAYPDRGL